MTMMRARYNVVSPALGGCGLLALLIFCSTASAASPRDELLRLVPDDTGLCLVVQNLRDQSTAFLASPFVKQFNKSPLADALRNAEEVKKLQKAEKLLLDGL